MRFKVDENLPVEIAGRLRQEGYDAATVAEQGLSGKDDSVVALIRQQEQRVLITLDLDFADIRVYPPDHYAGFIVLRLRQQDKVYVLQVFETVISVLKVEPLEQRLWIVEENKLRIRGV